MAKSLKEVKEEIAVKSDRLVKLFADKPVQEMSADEAEAIKRANDELTDLGKERDRLIELEGIHAKALAEHNANTKAATGLALPTGDRPVDPDRAIKTLEQHLVTSEGYKGYKDQRLSLVQLAAMGLPLVDLTPKEFKTLITMGDLTPQADRRPIVGMALEERTVADLMLDGETNRATIEYYEQTTQTNAAAEVSEGGTKPESALAWTLRQESVRKIGTWIPATDESLEDVPMMESVIRGQLVFMVRRREERQLLLGDGTAPNISGILDRSGIQTQAKGADPTPDAIYKGMNKVRNTGFAEPTAVVFHPNDWVDIRLLRTSDGIYIWGNPSEAGPERIWGLPIRQTTVMTEGTALVGAFRPWAQVFRRTGITVTMSTEHSTYFVENKVAILAEERLALAVYRPAAFCTVTGI